MKYLFILSVLLCSSAGYAQQYHPYKALSWQNAGIQSTQIDFTRTVNIVDYGADTTGVTSSNPAFAAAVTGLNGQPGVVFFPKGHFFFDQPITISRDSLIVRGAGYDRSQLRFDLGGRLSNLIQVTGTSTGDTAVIAGTAIRGDQRITLSRAFPSLAPGDWVTLSMDDASFMTSTWAIGSLSQLLQVQSISGRSVTFTSSFRFTYELARHPAIRKIIPRKNIGIECLGLERMDATSGQASNIAFDFAVYCQVKGIESNHANFAHIEVNHSSNLTVRNSYFHDAFAYGGNGQGYGVLLQFGTNECLVTANYFDHLRHSMILQAGANGNVLSYNYSTHPFWTEPLLPDSSSGDLVLHGNYPFMNLAEGNFVRNIVIDDSHGKNGPLNTFFRNRAAGYGIFMNFNPASDSVQFIGNEVTNNQIGLYFIQGNGHFTWGNNFRGTITSGDAYIPDSSLYLPPGQKPSCPNGYDTWPVVGRPNAFNQGTIEAKARVLNGQPASCDCASVATTGIPLPTLPPDWTIFPNPANSYVMIKGPILADLIILFDGAGRILKTLQKPADRPLFLEGLAPGIYYLRIISGQQTVVKKFVKAAF